MKLTNNINIQQMTISYIIIIHIVCYHQNHYVTPRINNLPLFDDDKQFIAKVK